VSTPLGDGGQPAVRQLERLLRADSRVAAVAPAVSSRDGRSVLVTAIGRDLPQSDAGQALVRRIREQILPRTGLADAARVGGAGAADLDLTTAIGHSVPWVIATVLLLSLLLLVAALRSLLLPLKALAMNLLSVGAAYGVVVAIFQWGWGAGLLGFTPEGQIQAFVPLFLFCVLFGLSMDYEVFMLTRIREEYLRTGDNRAAVATGLARTGPTLTSAALIMITIFAAFAGNRLLAFKAIGVGLAVAIFVDAVLIRVLAVPAAMRLLGRWNWWLPTRSRSALRHPTYQSSEQLLS
jgi:RND superfamily putative drug exporter